MLANTIDQAMNFCRLRRPLREQAPTGLRTTLRQFHQCKGARRVLRLIQVCRGERVLVGASLLANTIVQAMNFCQLHRPLREQAPTGLRTTLRQFHQCKGARRVLRLIQVCRGERVLVGASLLANTIDQAMNFCRLPRPLREQAKRRPARSHRSASSASTARSLTGATQTARQSARPVLRCPAR